jgi:hypothetical protein
MAIDYSIAAIPTEYNGRRYRSRLEARWCAFFDLLGWRPEHEPYDLGEWSPDFLVRPQGAQPILVEVKPIEECCDDTISRIDRACDKRKLWCGNEPKIAGVLLTRVAPRIVSPEKHDCVDIGWFANPYHTGGDDVHIGWVRDWDKPILLADVVHTEDNNYYTAMTGHADAAVRFMRREYRPYAEYTMGLWNAACNAVQWRGRDAT